MDTYYKELRQNLRCPKADQDRFLADVRQKVDELDGENPNLSCEDVISFLGSPKDLANSLMETLDPVVVRTYAHREKKRTKWIFAGLLAVILVLSVVTLHIYHLKSTAVFTYEDRVTIIRDAAPLPDP
jgi:uncharacterized membrane protein